MKIFQFANLNTLGLIKLISSFRLSKRQIFCDFSTLKKEIVNICRQGSSRQEKTKLPFYNRFKHSLRHTLMQNWLDFVFVPLTPSQQCSRPKGKRPGKTITIWSNNMLHNNDGGEERPSDGVNLDEFKVTLTLLGHWYNLKVLLMRNHRANIHSSNIQ